MADSPCIYQYSKCAGDECWEFCEWNDKLCLLMGNSSCDRMEGEDDE